MRKQVTIYCKEVSPRLHYVLDWLFCERLQVAYAITLTPPQACDLAIAYGVRAAGCVSIPALPYIFKKGNAPEQWKMGTWDGIPVLGCANGPADLPFDIFSAIFFLLSRQEEYYPHSPDLHDRFPPSESILYRHGWLMRPIVDEWVAHFRLLLQDSWQQPLPELVYSFQPTYDIDIAYSHSYKGFARLAGAYVRAFARGDLFQIGERTRVLKKKEPDPYDSFAWLRQMHEHLGYRPVYFVLCSLRTTAFDKNISPLHPAMSRVIRQMTRDGRVTIHPSYYANNEEVLQKEIEVLEAIIQKRITESRQHYIRLKLPGTYRLLAAAGITDDYSMGYGSKLGFRAGTGSSFKWFDLEKDQVTDLRVHPFCFMDTTAHFEHGYTAEQAFMELGAMNEILKRTGSTMVTIFHNFSLGTAREWAGWRQQYEQFMTMQAQKKAIANCNR